MLVPRQDYFYQLDTSDRIVGVGPNWDEFALENDGHRACTEHVLGQPLMEFVAGAEVRNVLRNMLRRTRAGESFGEIPFRCDSMDLRRYMATSFLLLPNDHVQVTSRLIDVAPVRAQRINEIAVSTDELLLVTCSWCKKARFAEEWQDLVDVLALMGFSAKSPVPRLSHGICPDCVTNFSN